MVTRSYLETAVTSPVAEAKQARDQAVAARDVAVSARDLAQSSSQNAFDWAVVASHCANYPVDQAIPSDPTSFSAKHHAVKASVSASAAALSASNAANSATDAATALGQLNTQRDEAVAANSAAQLAKAAAETAAINAVTARDGADTARMAAQVAQGQAESAGNASQLAEQSAGTSAANALISRDSAINARDSAIAARNAAQGHRDSAGLSATDAATARTQAQTHRNDALTFRNQAETFRNQAQATIGEADTLDGLHASAFALANHGHGHASTSSAGFMAPTDKVKLNGIAAGAQVNSVNSVNGKTGIVTLTAADIGVEGQRRYVRVKRTSPLSIAHGTMTVVTWNHQVDPWNMVGTGGLLIVPAGAKIVTVSANTATAWSVNGTGLPFAEIIVGGEGVARSRIRAFSDDEQSLTTGPIPVNGGETVYLQVLQTSNRSLPLHGAPYVNLSMEVWF